MPSPEAEKFADMLREAPRMAELPLADQRAAGEHAEDLTAPPEGITYRHVDTVSEPEGVTFDQVGDEHPVSGLWAVPPTATPDQALLYLFGGGHVITSVHARRKFAGHLALAAGVRVLALDYPLAPEHPFPADVHATTDGYRWLLTQAEQVALAGESSGGGLVLSTLLAIAQADLPRPAAAYLMSPWADLTCSGASFDALAAVDLECSLHPAHPRPRGARRARQRRARGGPARAGPAPVQRPARVRRHRPVLARAPRVVRPDPGGGPAAAPAEPAAARAGGAHPGRRGPDRRLRRHAPPSSPTRCWSPRPRSSASCCRPRTRAG